ncbi:hypothetical protein VHTUMSATKI_47790 [Vibrio harveyi]
MRAQDQFLSDLQAQLAQFRAEFGFYPTFTSMTIELEFTPKNKWLDAFIISVWKIATPIRDRIL